jgi:hypothetical protein
MTYFEFPYCKVVDGVATACTIDQVKKDNPSVSFPAVVPDETLADYGFYPLNHDSQTAFDIVERGPIEERNGEWWQTYTGRDKTPEEKRSTMVVTMRQARLALLAQGYLPQIQDALALISEPDKSRVQIEWEYASTVERNSVWVAVMIPALGLDDEAMDDLFDLAGTL